MEEDMAEDRHIWRLGMDRRLNFDIYCMSWNCNTKKKKKIFGLDDRGLILRNVLDVSPPSVCGNLQHCDSVGEGGGE